jgi:hydroxypyruvate isomerase
MDFTKYTLNCSILYGSVPVRDALSRATAAGFIDVEFWWPFTEAAPDDDEVTAFLQAVADAAVAGVRLKGMNLFAGNMAGGDRGVLSWPGREAELKSSVAVARRVADATGCQIFNALYGRRQPTVAPSEQDDLALINLAKAATALSEVGGTVVLEAISGVPDYPLKTADDVARVLDAGALPANVGLLLDVYHLSVNGDEVARAIATHAARISHVQLADAPGRGLPGTGTLPFTTWLDQLAATGYNAGVALEFSSQAADPFAVNEKESQ